MIDIPIVGNANTGIFLKQKNPFKAINKKYAIDKLAPVITKDIFYFLFLFFNINAMISNITIIPPIIKI
jgi:hypothetical protein